ncbi:hypothetical protein [Gandjariella thermophila]|uniref:Uncharacterized protein n=1 Tax=Gandjariella thermophila TaxID=1931992 RepID=A0A4D4J0Y9_9PSEU|nr:hypothetical protein [Gandjariella thermophila]GDY30131.1 hypothetical protein GTS_17640 [Gandjariella thermophila]
MGEEEFELLITVVVAADDGEHSRGACQRWLDRIGGTVVGSRDCSDEEPGCWAVTIRRHSGVSAVPGDPAGLARAVRVFVRTFCPRAGVPRIACEPPVAWTVLDDPEVIGELVPGGERMLVEAWSGVTAQLPPTGQSADAAPRRTDRNGKPSSALRLRVDVAAERVTAAEWRARVLAARISRRATIIGSAEHQGLQRVELDLGLSTEPPDGAVLAGAAALGNTGWSELEYRDRTAVVRWAADPRPASGIAALELCAEPAAERGDDPESPAGHGGHPEAVADPEPAQRPAEG